MNRAHGAEQGSPLGSSLLTAEKGLCSAPRHFPQINPLPASPRLETSGQSQPMPMPRPTSALQSVINKNRAQDPVSQKGGERRNDLLLNVCLNGKETEVGRDLPSPGSHPKRPQQLVLSLIKAWSQKFNASPPWVQQKPNYLRLHLWPPRDAINRKLEAGTELRPNARTLTWNVGIPSSIVTATPKPSPSRELHGSYNC